MSLKTQIQALYTSIVGDIRIVSNSLTGDPANANVESILNTSDKTIAGSINEVNAKAIAAANIDDAAPSTTTTYSSTKIEADIASGISSVIDVAPDALNTLSELSSALGNDENFAATITASIGTKVNASDVKTTTELGLDVDTFDYSAAYTAARNAA